MNPIDVHACNLTRRTFLSRSAVGSLALAALLRPSLLHATDAVAHAQGRSLGVINPLPLPQKAKRVIWMTMAGGPSHLETFDHKPKLAEMDGRPMPESMTRGQQLAQLQGQKLTCFAPQIPFRKFGRCGAEITEVFPHIGSIADDICIVRSMTSDAINHDPAHMFMNSGSQITGRPSMGAWITYGLGSEAHDLPGFVVLVSLGIGRSPQPIATRQWSSGFLPSKYQGVQLRGKGDPVLYLQNPPGVSRAQQESDVAAIDALNKHHFDAVKDPEISTRIAQYEMAFQMQASVPDLMDTSKESQQTLDHYGCHPGDGSFASNCLLARRLAERGVRFIQLYHRDWDHHNGVKDGITQKAKETDQAAAALVKDLKLRGMLDDTLVVWTGEFGRTPMSQSNKGAGGRDHHNKGFSMWLAGAGVKGGLTYGATDDLGYASVENVVTVHDLHATMLHQLGIEHSTFTYRFQGLDARLTGVESAKAIQDILV